ncbi:MAG: hypothetical protein Q9170_004101 [Blastenia crenularia]
MKGRFTRAHIFNQVTQQAMNYAIRSGITITASYAIKQSSRLLKTVEGNEKDELQDLQERLESKISSAVSLTKSLRREIQALGQRLATAATTDERARGGKLKAQDKVQHEAELKRVMQAIKRLLSKIEDAVPLINLAITASGTSLSSTLPSTVSPSRLLQASTFLTAGDTQYSINPSEPIQIGPTFTLSMYMLFAGHIRPQYEEDIRASTWKEVIHKANVKLMRVSLDALYALPGGRSPNKVLNGSVNGNSNSPDPQPYGDDYFPTEHDSQARAGEYAYQLLIVEDLEDDRVHTLEDDEPQPGPFVDVNLAGIREALPVHELSKIFYADTGKILNIGTEGEVNSPILLLKRDVNAVPPRRMDRHDNESTQNYGAQSPGTSTSANHMNGQTVIKPQLATRDRSPTPASAPSTPRKDAGSIPITNPWRIPQDLDPEWIAFEVYTESEDSDIDSELDAPLKTSRNPSVEPNLSTSMSQLQLNSPSPRPSPDPTINPQPQRPSLPAIKTSLSLLETLLRLLSLQQFQQTTHLSIPDELLTFFLSESASTGAASANVEERKRLRDEARRTVGFDPYDESPIKRRGEEYQYRGAWDGAQEQEVGAWTPEHGVDDERGYGTPPYVSPRYDEGYGTHGFEYPSPSSVGRGQSPLLLKGQRSRSGTPVSGKGLAGTPPVRWRVDEKGMKRGSPLARPGTEVTDEGLGSSPLSKGRSAEVEKGAEQEEPKELRKED